jgi:hypothetical protein
MAKRKKAKRARKRRVRHSYQPTIVRIPVDYVDDSHPVQRVILAAPFPEPVHIGHPFALSETQIAEGRGLYRQAVLADPTLRKHARAAEFLRKALNVTLSDRTLVKYIVKPVLDTL